MTRSVLIVAALATALLLPTGFTGDHDALARPRHVRGTHAAASTAASVTGTGGHVTVSVSCQPGGRLGPSDGASGSDRCRG